MGEISQQAIVSPHVLVYLGNIYLFDFKDVVLARAFAGKGLIGFHHR